MNNWIEFEKFGNLIESAYFQFAKTMPENHHYYTLRKKWHSDADFVWAVEYLRRNGYREIYGGRSYVQIDVNGYFYWTMGAPIGATTLINRKAKVYQTPYDQIGEVYDTLFTDEKSKAEDREVMSIIGDVSSLSVLDVGCGTGMFLDYVTPAQYTGIDMSAKMLERLKEKHPAAYVINTSLASFVGKQYDLVLALFGSASYLSPDEVERLSLLARPGGRVVAMFYDPDYYPYTYTATGIHVSYAPFRGQLSGETCKVNGAVLVDMHL